MTVKDHEGNEIIVPAASPAAAITPRRDGPLAVEGAITIVGADGRHEAMERAFLCRCGSSANKPFCDGAHKRVGFEADGVAPPAR